jgi:hypothetical protein
MQKNDIKIDLGCFAEFFNFSFEPFELCVNHFIGPILYY